MCIPQSIPVQMNRKKGDMVKIENADPFVHLQSRDRGSPRYSISNWNVHQYLMSDNKDEPIIILLMTPCMVSLLSCACTGTR